MLALGAPLWGTLRHHQRAPLRRRLRWWAHDRCDRGTSGAGHTA